MDRMVFLLGGGGHGRSVLDALLSSGAEVNSVIDPMHRPDGQLLGVPWLGDERCLERFPPEKVVLVNGLGANPDVLKRRKLFTDLKARGYSFLSVCHPSVLIGRECIFAEGTQLMAGSVLQAGVRVGDNSVVNTRASLDHDCVIGPHSFIAPGVVLGGSVVVGENVFIGLGALVLPGIEIGNNSTVGAGAVITKNVSAGSVVAGNPAARIGDNSNV